jgi:sensor histidine kinase regulating citrate/malate metabolism
LEKREIETKKFRHDLKHHVYALGTLADRKSDEYKQYYNEILEKIDELQNNISTKNGIVDAILNKFYVEAYEKGITFKVDGHMPDICYIEAYDLCSIFSNILSNAIEASESSSKKEVYVEINNSEDEIIITISNYYDGVINIKNDEIQTTKADKSMHGWGIKNIQDSVNKYNGCMDINTEESLFYITILLENIPKEII